LDTCRLCWCLAVCCTMENSALPCPTPPLHPAEPHAGSTILKAVLNAALPNFVDLLANDYRRWAAAPEVHGAERDMDGASGGGLFAGREMAGVGAGGCQ
jgi:hypothetical protein